LKKLLVPLAILLVSAFIVTGCNSGTTTTPAATVLGPTTTTPAASNPAATTPAATTAAPATTAPATSKPAATVTSLPQSNSSNKKYGGTLTWIGTSGPSGPIGYPPEVTGPSGVSPQIALQTLLKEMIDGSMKPGLAASYDVDTGTTDPSLTLHLRQGVKFSDGSDFNAAAVKWNLDNIKATVYYASSTANWKSVEVVDTSTVKIHFITWQNMMVRYMGDTMTYQVSPTAFQKNGLDWLRYNMVGTGPFVQSQWQRDVLLAGTKNPNYWEAGKPYLDSERYLFVADALTAVALFKAGGADTISSSDPTILNQLAAAGNTVVNQPLGPTSLIPDAGNADSPWSNLKVRQAAEYAIDKVALAQTFGFGWSAAYQFSTINSKAYDPTIAGRTYDLAKAKQLMADAGYPNGFKTTILASPIFLNTNVVLAIQNQLSKIGIVADTQFPLAAAWSDLSTKPWHNALLYTSINEWGNQNTTFNYFLGAPPSLYLSALKPAGWQDTMNASKATPDQDPVLLKKMENMITDNVMAIPLYYGANTIVFKPYVKDSGQGTRGQSAWHEPADVWLDR
jgi:peptide/nickel transport system substrate-binding protein